MSHPPVLVGAEREPHLAAGSLCPLCWFSSASTRLGVSGIDRLQFQWILIKELCSRIICRNEVWLFWRSSVSDEGRHFWDGSTEPSSVTSVSKKEFHVLAWSGSAEKKKIPTESKLCNLKFVWRRMVFNTGKVSSECLIPPTTKTNNRQLPNPKLNV